MANSVLRRSLGILYIYIHTYPAMARLVDLFLNGVTLGSGVGVSCDGWIEWMDVDRVLCVEGFISDGDFSAT